MVAIRYRADPADLRLVEQLDAMTAIYHRPSGQTHLMMEPVPQLLAAMGNEPLSAAEIAARLSGEFDLGDASAAEAAITARLEELAALGLAQRDA